GVADGARRHEQDRLSAERLGRAPVVGERVADARDGEGEEAAAGLDALAEARDARLAMQLFHAAVDVRDEQPRGVRPEVDGRDDHLRGTTAATRPSTWSSSSSASV